MRLHLEWEINAVRFPDWSNRALWCQLLAIAAIFLHKNQCLNGPRKPVSLLGVVPRVQLFHLFIHCFCSGAQLATSSGDASVKIWDFSKASCVLTFAEHTHAVWGVSWHSCGDFLASCSMDNTSKIWDLNRYFKDYR